MQFEVDCVLFLLNAANIENIFLRLISAIELLLCRFEISTRIAIDSGFLAPGIFLLLTITAFGRV
jgi:hypothetical protein